MSTLVESPHLYLAAYTLINPWVTWALEHGYLQEYCPTCQGAGRVHGRPCSLCSGTGDLRQTELDLRALRKMRPTLPRFTRRQAEPVRCPDCWVRCGACRGTKLRPPMEVCAQDFSDEDDIAIAELLVPNLASRPGFGERHLR